MRSCRRRDWRWRPGWPGGAIRAPSRLWTSPCRCSRTPGRQPPEGRRSGRVADRTWAFLLSISSSKKATGGQKKGRAAARPERSRGTGSGQIERIHQKRRHLATGDVVERTVVLAAEAARRDVLRGELLDPVGIRRRTGHVVEVAVAGRWHVARAVLGLQQEHGHLLPRHGVGRTVET